MAALRHWRAVAPSYAAAATAFKVPIYDRVTHVIAGHLVQSVLAASRGSQTSTIPLVLDVASGSGEPAATIAAALPRVFVLATDAVEEGFRAAWQDQAVPPNLSFQVEHAELLEGIPSNSCDVVSCVLGLESLDAEGRRAALQCFASKLRPGGMLVIAAWGDPSEVAWFAPLASSAAQLGRQLYDPLLPATINPINEQYLGAALTEEKLRIVDQDDIAVLSYFEDIEQMWKVVVESSPWIKVLHDLEVDQKGLVSDVRNSFEESAKVAGLIAPEGNVMCSSTVKIFSVIKPQGKVIHRPRKSV